MKAIRIVDYLKYKEIISVINLESITEVRIIKDTAQNSETMVLYQGDKEIIKVEGWVKNYEKVKEKTLSHFDIGEISAECTGERKVKDYLKYVFENKER